MSSLLGVVAIAVCALSGAAADDKALRGVAPQDVSKYSGSHFVCDKGVKFPISVVNDNYCDCEDGSDEPGTNAYANGHFYCENKLHEPKTIFSSMVNDGICDCCDGSDEYLTNACKNTCEEAGRLAREEALRLAEIQAKGYKIKLEMIKESNAKKEEMKARLAEIELAKFEHDKRVSELQAAVDAARAAVQARGGDVSAAPDQHDTLGDRAADAEDEEEEFDFFDDEDEAEDGDEAQRAAKLQEQVLKGRPKAEGEEPAPPQIDPELVALKQTLWDAEQALQTYQNKVRGEETEADDLRRKLDDTGFDFGPEGEFFSLKGECFDVDADKFKYTMCPFGRVDQNPGSISLGSTFAWTGKGEEGDEYAKYTEMQFTMGTPCWQGPARSTTVRVMCNEESWIENVNEPQKCVYTMDFYTPAVCRRPTGPYKFHDEL